MLQPLHAVIPALAQNQSILNAVVVILEKHVTQLAKAAFAQNLFLHSVTALISLTSAIQNVINYVGIYHACDETKSLRLCLLCMEMNK
jgi:hypothetical protein